ncbi:MAG: SMC-Scp complex subunit ScpB [Pseudomonadota bacterium]
MDAFDDAQNAGQAVAIDPADEAEAGDRMAGLSVREAQEALAKELEAELEKDVEALDAAPDDDAADADDGSEDAVAEGGEDSEEAADDDAISADADVDASDADSDDEASEETDADDPVWTAAEAAEHLKMLEALLFAAPEALDVAAIKKRLPNGADVPALLETLGQQYENRGVRLSKAGGRYCFATSPDVAHILTEERTETRKLSKAAMETLAIIAYHQPCTRADIEDVRGVAVSKGSIDQLLEMNWVRLAGRRRDAPGRPVLYATTKDFLEHFDLERISDLPGMADLKAAGLLEANLPPGFEIPSPSDSDAEDDSDGADDADGGAEAEFVQDFHDASEEGDSDADAIADDDESDAAVDLETASEAADLDEE